MKIGLQSDLHLEIYERVPDVPAGTDVMVWAGDIHNGTRALRAANTMARQNDCIVIVVAGNHEYFNNDYHKTLEKMVAACEAYERVHFLENDALVIDGVGFWGATYWSDYLLRGESVAKMTKEATEAFLPDFSVVGFEGKSLSPDDVIGIHHHSCQELEQFLQRTDLDKKVVITHFAPHPACDHPRHDASPFSSYFVSDQRKLIETYQPDLWCYGHTHDSMDFFEGKTRIVSNQYGYPHEGIEFTGFMPELLIEL